MTFWKRMLIGNLILISAATIATAGTFLLDYLTTHTNHPERLEIVFAITGVFMGFASISFSVFIFTNNFGEGLKKGGDL